jgi:hypothetical protein
VSNHLYVVRAKITTFGTSATAATLIALTAPAAKRIVIKKYWIEFDGVNAAEKPVFIEAQRATSVPSGTTTAFTPEAVDPANGAAVATALVYNASQTEGSPTMAAGETHLISPTSGIYIQEPLGEEGIVAAASFWRLRATVDQSGTPTAHGATFGVWFEE